MKTESVLVQTLSVPCASRCRYCLLSWDGKPVGVPWEQSVPFLESFAEWMRANRPDLSCSVTFGYSMEHPKLIEAIRFLRRLGSPQATFLQCDGMRMRSAGECAKLMESLREEGVRKVHFTVYGREAYHDRFANRHGDFALIVRMLQAAENAGLSAGVGIPVTEENCAELAEPVSYLQDAAGCQDISLFIPHGEGRGVSLEPVRLTETGFQTLPAAIQGLMNRNLFRTEREWLTGNCYREETKRSLIVSYRQDNAARYDSMRVPDILQEIEAADDAYYAAFPPFFELAERYGDPNGKRLYRQRDLFHHYRRLYADEFGVKVYDVTDERQSGSRRY